MNSLASKENIITLMWIPGHSGIKDKEMAGKATKSGISLRYYDPEHFIPISQSCWKMAVRGCSNESAKQNWHRKVGCKDTKELLPKFNPALAKHFLRLKRYKTRMVTEAITGIGKLGKQLSKTDIGESSLCKIYEMISVEIRRHLIEE